MEDELKDLQLKIEEIQRRIEAKRKAEEEFIQQQQKSQALHVKLNVGGRLFLTSKQTLSKYCDSMLESLVSGRHELKTLEGSDGSIFIDRDGSLFEIVLNAIRTEKLILPSGFTQHEALALEIDYYQLPFQVLGYANSLLTARLNANIVPTKVPTSSVGSTLSSASSSSTSNAKSEEDVCECTFKSEPIPPADVTRTELIKLLTANSTTCGIRACCLDLRGIPFPSLKSMLAVDFSACNLRDCTLSKCKECIYDYCDLRTCTLVGDFSGSSFYAADLSNVTCQDITFIGANFTKAILHNTTFNNCNFTQAVFNHSKMNGATFTSCNFSAASLRHSNWKEASFDDSQNLQASRY